MFRFLILLLIVVPALEVGLLILSGYALGIWPTIILIISTGVLGAWLAKREGLQALKVAQLQMQQGQLPNNVILDGLCILVGGVVLLTPGFLTDAFGFFLLIPKTRGYVKAFLTRIIHKMIQNGNFIIMTRR
ncbi:FxsA family protein [Halalkalibacter hemicellulosilyticus]|uniref:FxsA protein n=1 Tax=Halalkalibacter hemicellulosilyticusJCM 9152 TaxID=1236971 RepID=W4QDH6_9BACI|nr:FxsA family protein [Halalkalibacter hemicellulosilyticus]GAE30116.1 FxsA protein [Halalkalibacter hemicellulosilyticusJCM 9152]